MMKFSNRLFFYTLVTVVAYCRNKNKTPPAKVSKYEGLENSVFVYNGKIFAELFLDQKGNLDAKTLKDHCGPTVLRLRANSTGKRISIMNEKIKPNVGWKVFEYYSCVYPDSTEQPANSTAILSKLDRLLDKINEAQGKIDERKYPKVWDEINKMRSEIYELKDHAAKIKDHDAKIDEMNKQRIDLRSRVMKIHLKEALDNLGDAAEAAAELPGNKKVRWTRPTLENTISNLNQLLVVFARKRNNWAQKIRECIHKGDSFAILNAEIQKAVNAYRYLVCTGDAKKAHEYISRDEMDALLEWRSQFRVGGPNIIVSLLKIINDIFS